MNQTSAIGLSAVAGALLAGAAVYALIPPSAQHGDSAALATENSQLRTRVDDLEKKLSLIEARVEAQPAVAIAGPGSVREAIAAPAPKPVDATAAPSVAANVSQMERDTIFALIKEERDLRDRERQDKQRQQVRESLARRVGQAADRMGLDAVTRESLSNLYLDNMTREDEIRKAYPIKDYTGDDPNLERRKLELDAARKDLDARVAALLPADKQEDWDRNSRFLRRAGDFAEVMTAGPEAGFGMMRGMMDGGGGAGAFFGGGDRGPGGARGGDPTGGGRGNRNNRNNKDGATKDSINKDSAGTPAPPVKAGGE